MAKEPMDGPHELRLENRARLSVNGVREVESFTRNPSCCTRRREFWSMSYEEAQRKGGLFSRLLR